MFYLEAADYLVQKNNISIELNKEKYIKLANKIQKVQEIRNDIAHNYILLDAEGIGNYHKIKSYP